jgi:hypothetical protein
VVRTKRIPLTTRSRDSQPLEVASRPFEQTKPEPTDAELERGILDALARGLDDIYRVRGRMSGCSGCEASQTFTRMVFPGGSLHECAACGERWLALDE